MQQLNPKAVWLFFIGFVLHWFFFFIFLSIWGIGLLRGEASFSFLKWLWILVQVFLVLCFIWAKLTYSFYRYELTENGFRKELGVIYKKYITIPYDRIQNVDIYRGILARLLGLSDLNIQTAGMSGAIGAEGRLPALSREVAEQLRDELIQRARQS